MWCALAGRPDGGGALCGDRVLSPRPCGTSRSCLQPPCSAGQQVRLRPHHTGHHAAAQVQRCSGCRGRQDLADHSGHRYRSLALSGWVLAPRTRHLNFLRGADRTLATDNTSRVKAAEIDGEGRSPRASLVVEPSPRGGRSPCRKRVCLRTLPPGAAASAGAAVSPAAHTSTPCPCPGGGLLGPRTCPWANQEGPQSHGPLCLEP